MKSNTSSAFATTLLAAPASFCMSFVFSWSAFTMASTVSLALPKHMLVFSKKKSGFSTSA